MSTPGTPLPDDVEYNSHIESPSVPYCPYDPYECSEKMEHSHPIEKMNNAHPRTYINYRNPEPSPSGGVTSSSTKQTGAGTVNQKAYADTSSASMSGGITGTTSTPTGYAEAVKTSPSGGVSQTIYDSSSTGNSGAVSQSAYASSSPSSAEVRKRNLPDIDTGSPQLHGADPSRRRRSSASSTSNRANVGLTSNGMLGNQKTGHDAVNDIATNARGFMEARSWSEQPLVLAGIWLGIVGLVYAGWVLFGKLGELNPEGKREFVLDL